MSIPSQCPECHRIAITIREVPPDEHGRGEQWCKHAVCDACGEYGRWLDDDR